MSLVSPCEYSSGWSGEGLGARETSQLGTWLVGSGFGCGNCGWRKSSQLTQSITLYMQMRMWMWMWWRTHSWTWREGCNSGTSWCGVMHGDVVLWTCGLQCAWWRRVGRHWRHSPWRERCNWVGGTGGDVNWGGNGREREKVFACFEGKCHFSPSRKDQLWLLSRLSWYMKASWCYRVFSLRWKMPTKRNVQSSFLVQLSSWIVSANLYVSQQKTTGTLWCFAIIATRAVPARENTAPFECREWAPTKTVDTSVMTDPMDGRRR